MGTSSNDPSPRNATRRAVLRGGGALVGSALLGRGIVTGCGSPITVRQEPPTVVSYGKTLRPSRLQIGYVDTDRVLIPGDGQAPPELAERERSFVSSSLTHGNIHIMGWGLGSPWGLQDQPIDLTTLNAKIDAVATTGVEPIVTFCTAPWWMRSMQITGEPLVATNSGGSYSYPEWEHLSTSRVAGDRMEPWLELVGRIARAAMGRGVRTFIVWNELKGFWMNTGEFAPGKWNMNGTGATPGYKEFFSATRAEVLAARPADVPAAQVRVGGPYLDVRIRPSSAPGAEAYGEFDPISLQALDEWFDDQPACDFLVFGQWNVRPSASGIEWMPEDPYGASAVFVDLLDLLRGRYGVPEDVSIVLAEWYALRGDLSSVDSSLRSDADASLKACAALRYAKAGGEVLLNWSGHGEGTPAPGLWEPILLPDGSANPSSAAGQATPWGRAVRAFKAHFGPDQALLTTSTSSSVVEVLATERKTMLVNKTAQTQRVGLGGAAEVEVGPYEVLVVDTP